jgi:hypothetical protein
MTCLRRLEDKLFMSGVFLSSSALSVDMISSDVTGKECMSKQGMSGLIVRLEGVLFNVRGVATGLISEAICSAIVVKKVLKEFAMVSGSVIVTLLISRLLILLFLFFLLRA